MKRLIKVGFRRYWRSQRGAPYLRYIEARGRRGRKRRREAVKEAYRAESPVREVKQ